jgi:tol-pal system protein YbgF
MSGHLDGVNKSVASVVKTLESVSQTFTARFDEQDRRIDSLGRSLEQVGQKNGGRPQNLKQVQRSTPSLSAEAPAIERHEQDSESASTSHQAQSQPSSSDEATEMPTAPVASLAAPVEAPVAAVPHPVESAADRAQYERVLALFRDGDLEGARRGFTAFIASYPNSDLAPNARNWLGEAYYGAKDFKRAIDAYDKVELDYPRSGSSSAILKKGYAYLALKDKKRASSAFKQVGCFT